MYSEASSLYAILSMRFTAWCLGIDVNERFSVVAVGDDSPARVRGSPFGEFHRGDPSD